MSAMRFFSDSSVQPGKAHSAYQEYWMEHRDEMPVNLLRINGGMLPQDFINRDDVIYFHDARIQTVHINLPEISFFLSGDHQGDLREFKLTYSGVTSRTPIPKSLLEDVGTSDLSCHKTTIIQTGQYNHRMLFASGDIVSIDFSYLAIDVVDHL